MVNRMPKLHRLVIWIVLGGICVGSSACAVATPPGPPSASQLAVDGKTVFQQYCAKCHGDDGQKVNGSALMGPDNVLANYETGQKLYEHISQQMPDDHPASLSPTQYLQVESYLLLQDGYIKADTIASQNNLGQIILGPSH
jgi:mono/diheme cytochrome c family protein